MSAYPGRNLIAATDLVAGRAVKFGGSGTLVYAEAGDANIVGLLATDAPAGTGATIVRLGDDAYVDLGATVAVGDVSGPLAVVGSVGKLGPWDGVTGAAVAIATQAGGDGDRRRAIAFRQFPTAGAASS